MTCDRCQGLRVTAWQIDEAGGLWTGLRCLACGDYQDALIRRHRALPVPPEPTREALTPVYRPKRTP